MLTPLFAEFRAWLTFLWFAHRGFSLSHLQGGLLVSTIPRHNSPFGTVLRGPTAAAFSPVGGGHIAFGPPIAAMEVMVVCSEYCLLADLGCDNPHLFPFIV